MQQHRVYDLEQLISTVEKNGFNILEHGYSFIKPFSHKQMQECVDNNILNNDIIEGLNNMTKYIPELGSEIWMDISK